MSENDMHMVLKDKNELKLSEDISIGHNNIDGTDKSKVSDVNIGFNGDNSSSDNELKNDSAEDENKDKKSDVKQNKTNRKTGSDDDKKYKVGDNADKINEMAKRLCHFGFGLLFLFMSSIFPLFFIFALGSFTMAIVDNEIINDMLNSSNSIIKFCSRVCMLPELVASGVKRGVIWNESNMFTSLLTGGKIEYTQNKGLIHSTIESALQAVLDEDKSNDRKKENRVSSINSHKDKDDNKPVYDSETKNTETFIGYNDKKLDTTSVKPVQMEQAKKDIVTSISKSSPECKKQTKDISSGFSIADFGGKFDDDFSVKDDISIVSFPESKSSKSYKPSSSSTSGLSTISSDNKKNPVKSYIVSSTSSSSNTIDIKSENEQLEKCSSDFNASINDISGSIRSRDGSSTISHSSGSF